MAEVTRGGEEKRRKKRRERKKGFISAGVPAVKDYVAFEGTHTQMSSG